ncbi:lipopolysaccharide transport periplasmic protein LptA [Pseudodesulfovibrio sp. F-1]|uniref:Lipopolysaccharide transport periplasmic protein LptA n=1 Tax=Pseudodesulfovibrio alkaliphilus TaxID=2661613 RepID=A0A7K1KQ17_9BACT|nr:lipopolysaccharide transport periplasmic protein LptA [Pseudodesulfovibrio alkaliphilus]MUM78188.1 lipopolysaccharide transport periplasmic protein LptA [Pseudodesulfovibrio alkaliphilus]
MTRWLIAAACLLAFISPAFGADWGEVREAASNLNVREARSPRSEHVLTLTKGQRVRVDFPKDGWYAVFDLTEAERDESRALGYANARFLSPVEGKALEVIASPSAGAPLPGATDTAQTTDSGPARGEGSVKAPAAPTPPAPIQVGVDPSRVPVKITSDRMTYDENSRTVTFIGNVVAVHGELTLWANRLSAFLSSSTGKQFSVDGIERIVAEGTVRAKKGSTEGTCGKLTYFVEDQLLRMEDDPMLQDGPNSLTGEVINFHVRENRSEVVGGKGKRVKAIFLTPEKIKVQ